MGVRGLTSYISSCIDAAEKLRLPRCPGTQQADKHSQPRRVIVVDGYGCLLKLYHGTWLHGGQLGELREECRRFVEAWREAGFELVFIFLVVGADGQISIRIHFEGWVVFVVTL